MNYTKLKNDFNPSLLGFGCMRFPTLESGEINEVESTKLLSKAYENGINYFDLGHGYHMGKSENFVGGVLSKYERGTYYLATKIPMWLCETLDDVKKIIKLQMTDLRTNYIDFYLIHSVNKSNYEKAKQLGVIDYLFTLKEKGIFKNIGFSFHDTYEVFKEVINDAPWDFCQLQLNYMDMDIQAGLKGYNLCESMDIPVFVMEPVKGGLLASLPTDIEDMFKQMNPTKSIASWALRYIASFKNVKLVLSGMSNIDQLCDNLDTFKSFKPLNEKEMLLINKVRDKLISRINIGCTSCNYCLPCPAGVNIPQNFRIWNEYGMYQNKVTSQRNWEFGLNKEEKAANCVKCGKCEELCPQKLSIMESLEKLQTELDSL